MIEQEQARWTDLLQPLVVCQKSLLAASQKQIADLETVIPSLEDMSQMDMMKLQDVMQQHAQLISMIANIMKLMRDTSKAIIANIK